MRLISCSGCGSVIDEDRDIWPPAEDNSGDVIAENVEWDGDSHRPAIDCQICGTRIVKEFYNE